MLLGGFARLSSQAVADQARTIRIPAHMVETINKLIRISRQLLQDKGREPLPEEIAEGMGITVERVREQKIAQEPVSLETPIGEEEDSHLAISLKTKTLSLQMMQRAIFCFVSKLRTYLHALLKESNKFFCFVSV